MSGRVYRIINQINAGGMAEIFLGVSYNDFGFDQIVTIKRLNEKYRQDSIAQSLFLREANILRKFNHTNIINFIGFAEIDNQKSMITAFVHGRNARDLLEFSKKLRMNVSVSMAVHIATEVARGLHYCHEFRDATTGDNLAVIHSDISPENILISYEGEVKIIDFGVAQVPGAKGFEDDGKLKGKLRYMSPEFISSSVGSPFSDIYSLGMVLYELLTGEDLFTGTSVEEIYKKKIRPPDAQSLRSKNDQIDEELAGLVLKCINPNPNERYSSAFELEKSLSLYFHRRDPEYMPRKLGNFLKQVFAKDHRKIERLLQESVIISKDAAIGESIVIGDKENTKIPKSMEDILALFKNKDADVPLIHRGKTLELDANDKVIPLAIPDPRKQALQPSRTPQMQAQRPSPGSTRPPVRIPTSPNRNLSGSYRAQKNISRNKKNSANGLVSILIILGILLTAFLYLRSHPKILQQILAFLP